MVTARTVICKEQQQDLAVVLDERTAQGRR
jgi:hypothetical protein